VKRWGEREDEQKAMTSCTIYYYSSKKFQTKNSASLEQDFCQKFRRDEVGRKNFCQKGKTSVPQGTLLEVFVRNFYENFYPQSHKVGPKGGIWGTNCQIFQKFVKWPSTRYSLKEDQEEKE
jgi:hypothetical protein